MSSHRRSDRVGPRLETALVGYTRPEPVDGARDFESGARRETWERHPTSHRKTKIRPWDSITSGEINRTRTGSSIQSWVRVEGVVQDRIIESVPDVRIPMLVDLLFFLGSEAPGVAGAQPDLQVRCLVGETRPPSSAVGLAASRSRVCAWTDNDPPVSDQAGRCAR